MAGGGAGSIKGRGRRGWKLCEVETGREERGEGWIKRRESKEREECEKVN